MRLAVLIVMFCVLLQTFSRNVLLLRYQFNKKYYSEVLCTNKGLLVIDCEGNCRLLEDVEEEERRSANKAANETVDIVSLMPPTTGFTLHVNRFNCCWITNYHSPNLLAGWTPSIYQPPRHPFAI